MIDKTLTKKILIEVVVNNEDQRLCSRSCRHLFKVDLANDMAGCQFMQGDAFEQLFVQKGNIFRSRRCVMERDS